jgi:hypothetical protein
MLSRATRGKVSDVDIRRPSLSLDTCSAPKVMLDKPRLRYVANASQGATVPNQKGESMTVNVGEEFKPGDKVEASGIYRVTHDNSHAQPHDVTCVYGKRFPPCRGCRHPRFVLRVRAQHVESHEHFRQE